MSARKPEAPKFTIAADGTAEWHDALHPGRDLFAEWLNHKVTKVLALIVTAELARQMILRHGAKLLGLVDDAAGKA